MIPAPRRRRKPRRNRRWAAPTTPPPGDPVMLQAWRWYRAQNEVQALAWLRDTACASHLGWLTRSQWDFLHRAYRRVMSPGGFDEDPPVDEALDA
jgi:hypothetical protein